ncbi:helix-turn-helix domain-containing protein [Methylobacterium sp. Leaf113]|uniref:helix-turn-helix domain-containing protein n=1 Tax=Methylobacterium sp. Leaf113 TaxID=1736259 RepID=UPI0009E955FE|nr:helix-turn-helix domain-containing protein [Methylobacterium sp. Leaf113]
MARISLEQLRTNRPQVDREKLDATTEADIRRHTIEDGQDPDTAPVGYRLVPPPAEIRSNLGLTQHGFAQVLGVPLATYRNWEQGRKAPDPAAASLLTILYREPEAALRALRSGATRPQTVAFDACTFKKITKIKATRKVVRDAVAAPAKPKGKPRRLSGKATEAKDRA